MEIRACSAESDSGRRERIAHGTAEFPVACYDNDLAAASVPWHWHGEFELAAVVRGEAVAAAGAGRFRLREGEGIFVNAGILHSVWASGPGPCRLHSMVFHPRIVGGGMESVFWRKYVNPLTHDAAAGGIVLSPGKETGGVLEAFLAAYRACSAEADGYEFEVREQLSRVIFQLSGRRDDSVRPSQKSLRDGERMKRMLEFIQENYGEALTAPQIAAAASLSVSECLRCFKNTIGMTPGRYLNQYRLQAAAGLLRETGGRISDIALACGFQETSYFARVFRESMGVTPSEYRKKEDVLC